MVAAVIAVIDQATKYLAEDRLTPGVVVPLIGDYLGLQLIYNPGAAFSLATGMTWVLTIIMVVVIVVVLRVARRLRSTAWTVALGLLLGGALGNLYDRLLRDPGFGRGHVVDFINYNGWFVGNVADIAIVAAAVLIALLALLGREVDGTRSGAPESADPAAESPEEDSEPEYSPHLPQPSSEGADVASWAAGAPAVHAAGTSSVAEPEPVEYVRVCDAYGAGFFYIPGTEPTELCQPDRGLFGVHLVAGVLEPGRRPVQGLPIAVQQRYSGTPDGQQSADRQSDAAGGAGHEGHLAAQFAQLRSLSLPATTSWTSLRCRRMTSAADCSSLAITAARISRCWPKSRSRLS